MDNAVEGTSQRSSTSPLSGETPAGELLTAGSGGGSTSRSLWIAVGLALLGGILAGWLVIGWSLWPVQWRNTTPWMLRLDYRQMYVRLVAEHYAETGDIHAAREALLGWDAEDLGDLISVMMPQGPGNEQREQLSALVEDMALPEPAMVSVSSLLRLDVVVSFIVAVGLPLLTALVLAFLPETRPEPPADNATEVVDVVAETVPELPREVETEEAPEPESQADERAILLTPEEAESLLSEIEEEIEEESEEEQKAAESEQPGLLIGETAEACAEQPTGTGDAEDEQEEGADDEEEDWLEEPEAEDDLSGEEPDALPEPEPEEDPFLSLFEDDDESLARLERLAKELDEIAVDALAREAETVAGQLLAVV
jgi:hypothetical protein